MKDVMGIKGTLIEMFNKIFKFPGRRIDKKSNFGGLKHDPIEDTVEYKRVIAEVNQEVNQEVDRFMEEHHNKVLLGACHIDWAAKKRILKDKHDIDWKTPAEMNPIVCFD